MKTFWRRDSSEGESQTAASCGVGWEAGIRTPIPWSRATCPTVGRPPNLGFRVGLRLLGAAAGQQRTPIIHASFWHAPRALTRFALSDSDLIAATASAQSRFYVGGTAIADVRRFDSLELDPRVLASFGTSRRGTAPPRAAAFASARFSIRAGAWNWQSTQAAAPPTHSGIRSKAFRPALRRSGCRSFRPAPAF